MVWESFLPAFSYISLIFVGSGRCFAPCLVPAILDGFLYLFIFPSCLQVQDLNNHSFGPDRQNYLEPVGSPYIFIFSNNRINAVHETWFPIVPWSPFPDIQTSFTPFLYSPPSSVFAFLLGLISENGVSAFLRKFLILSFRDAMSYLCRAESLRPQNSSNIFNFVINTEDGECSDTHSFQM